MAETQESGGSPQAEPRPSRFSPIIQDYWLSYRSYQEFLRHVGSSLAELEGREPEILKERTTDILSRIPREAYPEVLIALKKVGRLLGGGTVDENDDAPDRPRPTDQAPSFDATAALVVSNILRLARDRSTTNKQKDLLYRSIITGVVGQFEMLVSEIAHEFYARAPGAVDTEDKVLSVSELRQFRTVDEAVDFVVDKKVDDLLRGSSEDWRKFFQTRMNVDLVTLTQDWGRFNEHIQRRHILVHTGGRVSRRYLNNVNAALRAEFLRTGSLGEQIPLDEHYVRACLGSLGAAGLRLAFEGWCKLFVQERQQFGQLLTVIIYDSLLKGDWNLGEALASWGSGRVEFDAAARTVYKFNHWLCIKRRGRWPDIREEVSQYDTSALDPRFSAAHASLMDDANRFFAVIDKFGGAGLHQDAWEEWPIFDEMRTDDRFDKYKKKYLGQPSTTPESGGGDPPVQPPNGSGGEPVV